MKRSLRLATAVVAATILAAGSADAAPRAGGFFHGLAALDTNKDGYVDQSEFRAGEEQHFTQLDTNRDGLLSRDEMPQRRWRQGPAPASQSQDQGASAMPRGPARDIFSRIDANGDGALSKEEFMVAGDKVFQRMDQNGDGRIQLGECMGGGRGAPHTK